MLALFDKSALVSTRKLASIALKYSSRISELRAAGYNIRVVQRDHATGNNLYALVPAKKPSRRCTLYALRRMGGLHVNAQRFIARHADKHSACVVWFRNQGARVGFVRSKTTHEIVKDKTVDLPL